MADSKYNCFLLSFITVTVPPTFPRLLLSTFKLKLKAQKHSLMFKDQG